MTAVTKARRDPDATTSPLPPAPLLPRALQEGGMLPGGAPPAQKRLRQLHWHIPPRFAPCTSAAAAPRTAPVRMRGTREGAARRTPHVRRLSRSPLPLPTLPP